MIDLRGIKPGQLFKAGEATGVYFRMDSGLDWFVNMQTGCSVRTEDITEILPVVLDFSVAGQRNLAGGTGVVGVGSSIVFYDDDGKYIGSMKRAAWCPAPRTITLNNKQYRLTPELQAAMNDAEVKD